MRVSGRVVAAQGGLLHAAMPAVNVGEGVRIASHRGAVTGVVIALHGKRALIAAHGTIEGVAQGNSVHSDPSALAMPLGVGVLGRAFDGAGRALDGGSPLRALRKPIGAQAPEAAQRSAVDRPFWTGIRAIDGLLTIGRGARVGFFGAPGAGKSRLLQQIVAGAAADAVVVGLVGERGREAEEWLQRPHARRSVVCATADCSAAERVRAAQGAMAQAHALRDRGLHVLLVLDSLARFASALREVATAAGEPVGRAGFPASVFAQLARFLEIAGATARGSITLIATVLSDGDERDPVSDCARSLLDGHLELSPKLAHAGHFPAIDVLASASRTMATCADPEHRLRANNVRRAIAFLAQTEDARLLGIMPDTPGAGAIIAGQDAIRQFLCQGEQPEPPGRTLLALRSLADKVKGTHEHF